MLILTRKPNERIMIGEDIIIEILGVNSTGQVRLGITAPDTTSILREEIFKKIKSQGEEPKSFVKRTYPRD